MKVLEKVAKALSRNYGIKVQFKGTQAYTDYKSIVLPMLPDNINKDDEAKVRGYCDHEIGHLLHTDPKVSQLAHLEPNTIKNMRGLLEDFRIERDNAATYIGTRTNMERTAQLLISENTQDLNHIMTKLWIEGRRKMLGYTLEAPDFGPDVKGAFGDDVFDRIIAMGSGKTNCMDALELARQLVKEFEDKKEQTKQEQNQRPDQGQGKNQDSDDQDRRLTNPSDQDDEADEDEQDKPADPNELDDSDNQCGNDDDDNSDDLDDPAADGGGDNPKDNEPADTDGAGQDDGIEDDAKDEKGESPSNRLNLDNLEDDIASWDDMNGDLQKQVEQMSKEAVKGNYLPFSRAYDKIKDVTPHRSIGAFEDMKARLGSLNSVKAKISRLFLARQISRWTPDKEEGKINTRKLASVKSGNRNIFKTKESCVEMDTAISLLCDCSGSMCSSGIRDVMTAVILMLETLKTTKIKTEVLGFTTDGSRINGAPTDQQAQMWTRTEAIVTYVIKKFDEPYNQNVKLKIAGAPDVYQCNNHDPDNLMIAYERISRQKAARKIIFVLSDGKPSSRPYGYSNDRTQMQLIDLVKDLTKKGIEVIGIGMGHNVKRYYPKNIEIDDTDKITDTIYNELKRIMKVK